MDLTLHTFSAAVHSKCLRDTNLCLCSYNALAILECRDFSSGMRPRAHQLHKILHHPPARKQKQPQASKTKTRKMLNDYFDSFQTDGLILNTSLSGTIMMMHDHVRASSAPYSIAHLLRPSLVLHCQRLPTNVSSMAAPESTHHLQNRAAESDRI